MTRPSRVKVVLAFAAVYVLWGSTYLAIRLAIDTLPPFLMTGTRFTLAGLILFTWAVLLNWAISRQRPNWKVLLGVLIGLVGVAMLVGDGLRSNGHSKFSLIAG